MPCMSRAPCNYLIDHLLLDAKMEKCDFVNLISFITSKHKYLEGRKVVIMLDDTIIFIDPY
jgi:hypothetical protein